MTNRVAAANDALSALLDTAFASLTRHRNPDGARAWASDEAVCVLHDDEEPEVLRTLSGPVYDLKLVPTVTLARKSPEPERRDPVWADVDALKVALAADVTLGGAVEDARIETVVSAELDRTRWAGGGLEVSVRLLFAAASAAG